MKLNHQQKEAVRYAHEKFISAVYNLATSPEKINERLTSAWMSFHTVRAEDLPDDLKNEFILINEKLKGRDRTKGTVEQAIAKMTEEEAADLARKIVDFDGHVSDYYMEIYK
jgi:hypothetical protein